MNPLLDFSGLPRFDAFKIEYITPAVDALIAENRALIKTLGADPAPPAWENFVQPLEDANERLARAWGQVAHLNAVMNSLELREVYNANLPKITQYHAELAQDLALYRKLKALRTSPEFEVLSRARKKIIDNELRDFRLGGADLASEQKARFLEIQERLASVQSRFSDNLLDATNDFVLSVDNPAELTGLPEDALEAAREAAAKDGKEGWKFTLHAPSYLPVMQYADHRPLREKMYRAYVTRAAEFGKPEWDNTPLITEILGLRLEQARLLGFADYAEVSLEPKMAQSPREVLDFLNELAAKAKPYAERDLAQLAVFARDELGLGKLEAWDLAYAAEKLRLKRYAFSEQEVKHYFPETTVLPGMFRLVEKLYRLAITPSEAPRWHPDVRFYEIRNRAGAPASREQGSRLRDATGRESGAAPSSAGAASVSGVTSPEGTAPSDGALIGQFYVDLYARPSKRGGAWMDDAITRRRVAARIQTPVAYLNCNFSGPVGSKPPLFTHDEVITLFHEFGHGLHHLLTRVEELGVSGINGVEWDAVELPSQFMENFCWEWEVLSGMSAHADTGAPLPRALFDKMLAAKNFQMGMQTVKQLEFSLFDMHLHHDFVPSGTRTAQRLLDEVRARVAVVIPPAFNRFPNSFSHIFSGGYAAGYYSYKWAEVLSADAYSVFEENGVLNPEIGARFLSEILAAGGSRPALESFIAFRGREPRIDALLRRQEMEHHGEQAGGRLLASPNLS